MPPARAKGHISLTQATVLGLKAAMPSTLL
jgi:hypothetical protein